MVDASRTSSIRKLIADRIEVDKRLAGYFVLHNQCLPLIKKKEGPPLNGHSPFATLKPSATSSSPRHIACPLARIIDTIVSVVHSHCPNLLVPRNFLHGTSATHHRNRSKESHSFDSLDNRSTRHVFLALSAIFFADPLSLPSHTCLHVKPRRRYTHTMALGSTFSVNYIDLPLRSIPRTCPESSGLPKSLLLSLGLSLSR